MSRVNGKGVELPDSESQATWNHVITQRGRSSQPIRGLNGCPGSRLSILHRRNLELIGRDLDGRFLPSLIVASMIEECDSWDG